jgi:hypothetical protein
MHKEKLKLLPKLQRNHLKEEEREVGKEEGKNNLSYVLQ